MGRRRSAGRSLTSLKETMIPSLERGAEGHLNPLTEGDLHAGGDGVGEGMRHVFVNDVHDHLSKHSIPLPSLHVEKFSTSAENVRVGRYAYNPQTAK